MSLTPLEQWELKLKQALDTVDMVLEHKYGGQVPRNLRRPVAGSTSNSKYDGLFGINAKFTMGFASTGMPGYIIELRISSSTPVSEALKMQMLADMEEVLPLAIREAFPGKHMVVERQGEHFMLSGDLGFK